jgi:hypothetical protein
VKGDIVVNRMIPGEEITVCPTKSVLTNMMCCIITPP